MDIKELSESELKALALRKNSQGQRHSCRAHGPGLFSTSACTGLAITSCCPGGWIAMGTTTPRRENQKDERPDLPREV